MFILEKKDLKKNKELKFLKLLAVLITTIGISGATAMETEDEEMSQSQSVKFNNRTITMEGNLFRPNNFDAEKKYSAIICVHPGGGVKEQTAGLYAQQLAKKGFITLAFDASYQGASGGSPHFLDEPMNRVADVWSAVDYMTTLSYVDLEQIGVLGICAGSGFSVKAASIDHRIKVVGTVSAVNVGAATRKGWEGKGSEKDLLPTIDALGKQRTAEASGADVAYAPYVPKLGDTSSPHDLQEAAEYYLNSPNKHPNAQNKMLMNGLGAWIGFDAFDLVEALLTQPVISIAGSNAGSLWHTQELQAKAPGQKELVIVEGATHMDFYAKPEFVNPAVSKISQFFEKHLELIHEVSEKK